MGHEADQSPARNPGTDQLIREALCGLDAPADFRDDLRRRLVGGPGEALGLDAGSLRDMQAPGLRSQQRDAPH